MVIVLSQKILVSWSSLYLIVNICQYYVPFSLFYCLIVVVSAKGFYTRQHVIDFVCETLNMSYCDLDDTRVRIDKEKLKKAISGNVLVFLCVQFYSDL